MRLKRTIWVTEVMEHIGEVVTVNGWVTRLRHHQGTTFIDLRDDNVLLQVVITTEAGDYAPLASSLKREDVVGIRGQVLRRNPSAVNPNLLTGEVELILHELEVINPAHDLPFPVDVDVNIDEDTRLHYRYLDLRHPAVQHNLRLRSRLINEIHNYLQARRFIEVNSPVHEAQLNTVSERPFHYKPLLIGGGFDRCYQLARCVREPQADELPEFTLLDLGLAFVDTDDLIDFTNRLISYLLSTAGLSANLPFQAYAYKDTLTQFGSETPDLRYAMKITDLPSQLVEYSREISCAFKQHGRAAYLYIPRTPQTEARLAALLSEDNTCMVWVLPLQSNGLSEGLENVWHNIIPGPDVIAVLMVGSDWLDVSKRLGKLRSEIADLVGWRLTSRNVLHWVTALPLFKWNGSRWEAAQKNPFAAPQDLDIGLLDADPISVQAQTYKLVMNGYEIAEVNVHAHHRSMQERLLRRIGLTETEIQQRFGQVLNALDYGTPPHGGITLDLDRIVMLLTEANSLRDVTAFPKTFNNPIEIMDDNDIPA